MIKEKFLKHDILLVGIAHDSVKSMKTLQWCEMPMIADASRKIVLDYRTFMLKVNLIDKMMGHAKIARPITYLLDNNRRIVWKHLGNALIRPSIKELFEALEQYFPV